MFNYFPGASTPDRCLIPSGNCTTTSLLVSTRPWRLRASWCPCAFVFLVCAHILVLIPLRPYGVRTPPDAYTLPASWCPYASQYQCFSPLWCFHAFVLLASTHLLVLTSFLVFSPIPMLPASLVFARLHSPGLHTPSGAHTFPGMYSQASVLLVCALLLVPERLRPPAVRTPPDVYTSQAPSVRTPPGICMPPGVYTAPASWYSHVSVLLMSIYPWCLQASYCLHGSWCLYPSWILYVSWSLHQGLLL